MLARSKLNNVENKISETLINNEISHEFLMKKSNIRSWKKALEWWTAKEVMLKKLVWLKKVKK